MSRETGSRSASEISRWEMVRDTTWRLVVSTVGTCYRNRVTGLAAEAAFFALLSLPPLIFALVGSIGYVFESFSDARTAEVRAAVVEASSRVLTEDTVRTIIEPTLNDVFRGGRYDVISIGFVLALWSGSRALNVFVDTITIMYGLGGHRGIVKTRILSFVLYVLGLVTGVVTIPLVVAGPTLVQRVVPARFEFVNQLYWPAVVVLSICFLATLYHASVPVRTSWRYNLPGATLTLAMWVLGSFVLRWVLTTTAGESTSIYGPLAAPIAVLLWLYLLSIAVLIGAAVNAAFDRVWPESETARARMELVRRLRLRAMLPRLRRDRDEQRRFGPADDEDEQEYDEAADHDERVQALEEVHDEVEADARVADDPEPGSPRSTRPA
ncbi:MAG TPA: YihY/virulence factor BrkB family protein [Nocardioidaceae bacterium]|nr:YihY/virulence factor BrkB family protein [Nocardioidaceae bacterium]